MHTKQLFNYLCIGFFLYTLGSCATSDVAADRGIQKRKYRKGWSTNKQTRGFETSQDKTLDIYPNTYEEQTPVLIADNSEEVSVLFKTETTQDIQTESILYEETNNVTEDTEENSTTLSSEPPCDLIMLKNGEEINAKVTEIGSSEIKYKLCDNLEGPVYTLNKQDVFKIKYANGTNTLISEIENSHNESRNFEQQNKGNRPLTIMAILGIGAGVLSIFIPFFGIIALGLGITALILHARKPEKERSRKVRSLSIWAIIAGAVTTLFTIIVIAILY